MNRLRQTLTSLLLVAALLPLSATALPADTTETNDDPTTAKSRIFHLLNAEDISKQEQGVRLIGQYAHTGQFDENFYRVLVTPLRYLVVKGETESLRIMAVSALFSIGTDEAIGALKAHVDNLDSNRLARVMENALKQHEADRTAAKRTSRGE